MPLRDGARRWHGQAPLNGRRVLLADIGGTHARFALADPMASAPLLDDSIDEQAVDAHASLADATRAYLQGRNVRVERGIFAVAGPVHDDEVRMTNHPWRISRTGLCQALALDDAVLVNDFVAQAMALRLLRDDDLVAIGAPSASAEGDADADTSTRVILGPGTGLGVAALLRRDGREIALATEGGHLAFAPGTPEEAAILQLLTTRFGRVSNERLLSGSGLVNLHRALGEISDQGRGDQDNDPGLQPTDISAGAKAGDARCVQAVTLFCDLLGAVAGDMVLALGAWDGAYLSGGILPQMLPMLQQSDFRLRFEAKGRYTDAVARVPTRVVMHPQPGLLGAAAMAMPGSAAGPQ